MEEIWKSIPNYEGRYEISNHGRVKSFTGGKEKVLKTIVGQYGYSRRVLRHKNELGQWVSVNHRVHRLVAEAFIPNPENLATVNHIDGDKLNNQYTNLEWLTLGDNVKHSITSGLRKPGNGFYVTLDKDKVRRIRSKFQMSDISIRDLADQYGISGIGVYNALTYKTWELVDIDLKQSYTINQMGLNKYKELHPTKIDGYNYIKITPKEMYEQIGLTTQKELDDLIPEYVNSHLSLTEFAKKYDISRGKFNKYFKRLRESPKPTPLEDEEFRKFTTKFGEEFLVSNHLRVYCPLDRRLVNRKFLGNRKIKDIYEEIFDIPKPEPKPKKMPYVLTDEIKQKAIKEYTENGLSHKDIKKKLGIPSQLVPIILKGFKKPKKEPNVSREIVDETRRLYYRENVSVKDIAKKLDLTSTITYEIIRHKIYPDLKAHIEDTTAKLTAWHENEFGTDLGKS